MLSEQAIKRWHLGQIIVQEILIIVALVLFFKIKPLAQSKIGAMVVLPVLFVLILLQLTLLHEKHPARKLVQFNHYFQAANIQICFLVLLTIGASFIKVLNTKNLIWLLIPLTLYELVMLVPMAELAWGKISSVIGQIITLLLFSSLIVAILEMLTMYSYPSWLQMLNKTEITGAICFVITSVVAMNKWGYQTPGLRLSSKAKYAVLGFIALFIIIDCLFNAFNVADKWGQLLTSWDFQITTKHIIKFICEGIAAGIAEEWLMRFCVLSILLKTFKNAQHQILWSVVLDGLIFGALHIVNLIEQPIPATILQMINASVAGITFAAIYLYTGSFFINMGYHAVFDILAFLASGTTTMTNPTVFEWQYLILTTLAYLAFSFFLLSGKRKNVVEYNMEQWGLADNYGVYGLNFK